jgi:hypothetical protein
LNGIFTFDIINYTTFCACVQDESTNLHDSTFTVLREKEGGRAKPSKVHRIFFSAKYRPARFAEMGGQGSQGLG